MKTETENWNKINENINELINWLNKNDIDFEVKIWESAEGKDVITENCVFEFYRDGYVKIITKKEYEDEN